MIFVLLCAPYEIFLSSQYLYIFLISHHLLFDISSFTAYDASGVSIIEDGSEGITMELEMQWDGNPSIVLDIKTYLGVGLPVQVSRCGF